MPREPHGCLPDLELARLKDGPSRPLRGLAKLLLQLAREELQAEQAGGTVARGVSLFGGEQAQQETAGDLKSGG